MYKYNVRTVIQKPHETLMASVGTRKC